MIPLHLKTREFSEPSSSLYYLVAANGVFLVKRTRMYTSITPTDRVVGLEEQSPSLTFELPKLPLKLLESVYGFFDAVFRKWKGEAIVFLYYNPEAGTFRVGIPPQTVSRYQVCGDWFTPGHMEYGSIPRPDGFVKLGDIHSHGEKPAFFSSVDDRDDEEDGLRIVMGSMDRGRPDICASFVAGGTRFWLETEEIVEGFGTPRPPPEEWLEKVTCREETVVPVWREWPGLEGERE